MPRPRPTALAVALASAALVASPSFAQQDPMFERGFDPEKLYQLGGIDQVNLFNGNLSLAIPIGGTYHADGALTYGLTLSYNAKIWEIYHTTPSFPGGSLIPAAKLNDQDNAGIGWQLSLGRLFAPADPQSTAARWVYHGEDGSEYELYKTLHENEPEVKERQYTRDGSYLRLAEITQSIYDVEFPDGMVRRFTRTNPAGPFVLTQIRDRFGNSLSVAYLSNPVRWKLDDGHRVHWVYFKTVAGYEVVDRVELAASGGTTATYTFTYANPAPQIHEHCGDQTPSTPTMRTVALLASVSLPADGGSYQMNQPGDYYTSCEDGPQTIDELPGALRRLRLPTRGILEWSYQDYFYPARGVHPPGEPGLEIVKSLGIKTKRLLDASGSCAGCGRSSGAAVIWL
jgi:hypothetical protein